MNTEKRRELVQQMSSATNLIPGSIGERRKMRQELDAMVHHIEAETADLRENAGAGRIPAGFCTLTCSVYKWQQLHETLLKSFPSGPSHDPKCREYYSRWEALPPGPAKEAARQKAYYDLSVINPGAVAWYCALKLEMLVHLTKALLTEQLRSADVPGLEAAKARLKEELERKLGVEMEVDEIPDLRDYGLVDDFYVSFEWSDGGMIHAHMAFWIVGAPRIDKVEVPKEEIEEIDGKQVVEIEALPEGATVLPQSEAADSMATFWDRCITEFNVAKALAGVEGEFCQRCSTSTENVPQTLSGDDVLGALGPRGDATVEDGSWARMCEHRAETGIRIKLGKAREREFRSPEAISYRTYAHCLLEGLDLSGAEEEQCWDEFLEIMRGCSRIEEAKLKEDILGPISASAAQKRARARKHFVAALAELVNMHDSHKPFALGPPGKEQSCACVDDEHSKSERTSCNKLSTETHRGKERGGRRGPAASRLVSTLAGQELPLYEQLRPRGDYGATFEHGLPSDSV